MDYKVSDEFDIAVLGAGPAGLTAAIQAATHGARVVVIDENHLAGGQLIKQIHKFFGSKAHLAGTRGFQIAEILLEQCKQLGVEIRLNSVVFGIFEERLIGVYPADSKSYILEAKKIVVATGADEKSIAFPGWTLPGVMGAGALQTMINLHRVLPGKRILMIGSGNVGLIVSYQALQAGAEVCAVIDVAPKIGGYGVHAAKIRREGVPILTNTGIKAAKGNNKVESAIIIEQGNDENNNPGKETELDIDLICLSVGLRPAVNLGSIIGCECPFEQIRGGYYLKHDHDMKTTNSDIFAAGDVTGIEEASTAMEEGKLAGISAAESLGLIPSDIAVRKKSEVNEMLEELRCV